MKLLNTSISLSVAVLIASSFLFSCSGSRSKPSEPTAPASDERPDNEAKSEVELSDTVLTSLSLSTEAGDVKIENIGWKESTSELTRIYDLTRIQTSSGIRFWKRSFEVETLKQSFRFVENEVGTESQWMAAASIAKPIASWKSEVSIADALVTLNKNFLFGAAVCADHPYYKSFRSQSKQQLVSNVLVRTENLFLIDRITSRAQTAIKLDMSGNLNHVSIHTVVQGGYGRYGNPFVTPESTEQSLSLVTANPQRFLPEIAESEIYQQTYNYRFVPACEYAFRDARVIAGPKSDPPIALLNQLVDKRLEDFTGLDLEQLPQIETETISQISLEVQKDEIK